MNTLLKAWTNAWITSSRFQTASSCPFCSNYTDSIPHLTSCRVTQSLARHHLNIHPCSTPREALFQYLILDSRPSNIPSRLVHLHVLHLTFNQAHHNSSTNLCLNYRANLLSLASRHPAFVRSFSPNTNFSPLNPHKRQPPPDTSTSPTDSSAPTWEDFFADLYDVQPPSDTAPTLT